jgi:hypothetical protein
MKVERMRREEQERRKELLEEEIWIKRHSFWK